MAINNNKTKVSAVSELTLSQEQFCHFYVNDINTAGDKLNSYRKAYPDAADSTCKGAAYRLMDLPRIQAKIKELTEAKKKREWVAPVKQVNGVLMTRENWLFFVQSQMNYPNMKDSDRIKYVELFGKAMGYMAPDKEASSTGQGKVIIQTTKEKEVVKVRVVNEAGETIEEFAEQSDSSSDKADSSDSKEKES